MNGEPPAQDSTPPALHMPTDTICRDGGEHDWKLVMVSSGYSYHFCQKCGHEKGRPKQPPTQCPP